MGEGWGAFALASPQARKHTWPRAIAGRAGPFW
jgi:hypothetical protein